jgi:predicted TIM-barrel fold metal-dependent hydrolase
MLHGRRRDRNLSEQEFWPIFEAAEALQVPLYLHPQSPQQAVLNAYYKGFGEEIDSLFARAGIGWHYETGIQIIRMILAGVFDRFPNLTIVTGHWGEVVLSYLDRADMLSGTAKLPDATSAGTVGSVHQLVLAMPNKASVHREPDPCKTQHPSSST